MALVVLLRGVNVGGHRKFRPKRLAEQLRTFDVVNIGAAGTFVVRKPGPRARFLVTLRSRLPATTQFVCCDGRDLLRAEAQLGDSAAESVGTTRFVSFLENGRARPPLPLSIPSEQEWFVRVSGRTNRILVGEYRRHMKTIGCLGQLDALFATLVTTRSLSTVNAIMRVLNES